MGERLRHGAVLMLPGLSPEGPMPFVCLVFSAGLPNLKQFFNIC
jgi:hypothetical protein